MLKPVDGDEECNFDFPDFDIFIGHDFCITVSEGDSEAVRNAVTTAERLAQPDRPDQIFYRLFDSLTDSYLPAIDRISDRIDMLEDKVLEQPSPAALQEIFHLKRALADLRRVLVNTRDVSIHLQRDPGSLIAADLFLFFRDIYDHIARNVDSVETQRDLLNGSLDVYLSSVANRTNEVMKVLTILSTIAIPAVVITGIYGMNIKGIPFIDSSHGIEIVVLLIVGSTLSLLWLLRHLKWF